jgi:hypothetical protein
MKKRLSFLAITPEGGENQESLRFAGTVEIVLREQRKLFQIEFIARKVAVMIIGGKTPAQDIHHTPASQQNAKFVERNLSRNQHVLKTTVHIVLFHVAERVSEEKFVA